MQRETAGQSFEVVNGNVVNTMTIKETLSFEELLNMREKLLQEHQNTIEAIQQAQQRIKSIEATVPYINDMLLALRNVGGTGNERSNDFRTASTIEHSGKANGRG